MSFYLAQDNEFKLISDHEKCYEKLFGNDDNEMDENENNDPNDLLAFEEKNPKNSIFVYAIDYDLGGNIFADISFYVCKVPNEDKTYLLFSIRRDDNLGGYIRESCAAITGVSSHEDAEGPLLRRFAEDRLPDAGGGEWEKKLKGMLHSRLEVKEGIH